VGDLFCNMSANMAELQPIKGGSKMDLTKFKSRKLWVALGASLILVLNEKLGLGLTPETVQYLTYVAGAYVIGQGIADKK